MFWRRSFRILGLILGLFLFLREILQGGNMLIERSVLFLNVPLLLLAALLNMPAYFVQILSWTMIMRYLGVSLSLRQSIRGYPSTFLARYIPGSVWGYWSRSEWLKESYNVSYACSLLASILEVILLLLVAAFLVTLGISSHLSGLKRIVTRSLAGILLIFMVVGIPRLTYRITRGFPQITRDNKYWYKAIVLAGILFCLYGGTLLFVSRATWPTSSLDLMGAIYVTSFSWLLGFVLIFIPAGIGVRETVLSSLLISHFGLPVGPASLAAVTLRFVLVLTEAGWLVTGLILLGQDYREKLDKRS